MIKISKEAYRILNYLLIVNFHKVMNKMASLGQLSREAKNRKSCGYRLSFCAQQYLCIDKLNILKNQKPDMVKTNSHGYQSQGRINNSTDHCSSIKSTAQADKHNFENDTIRRPTPRNGGQTQQQYNTHKFVFEAADHNNDNSRKYRNFQEGKNENFEERCPNEKNKKTIKYRPKQTQKTMYQLKEQAIAAEVSISEGFKSKQNQNVEQTNSTRCQHASIKQHTNSEYLSNTLEPETVNNKNNHCLDQFQSSSHLCFSTPLTLDINLYGNLHSLKITSIFSYVQQIELLLQNLRLYFKNINEAQKSSSLTDFEGVFLKNQKNRKCIRNQRQKDQFDHKQVGMRVIVLSRICEQAKKNKFIGKSDELLIISFQKLLDKQINTYSQGKIQHRQHHQSRWRCF